MISTQVYFKAVAERLKEIQ